MKKYNLRIYIYDDLLGMLVNNALDWGFISLLRSFEGKNGCMALYDVSCGENALKMLLRLGIDYLPLDNYGDFVITCPKCGERIDDAMILTTYDDTLLSGYNILCNRDGCGYQRANVKCLL